MNVISDRQFLAYLKARPEMLDTIRNAESDTEILAVVSRGRALEILERKIDEESFDVDESNGTTSEEFLDQTREDFLDSLTEVACFMSDHIKVKSSETGGPARHFFTVPTAYGALKVELTRD